MTQPSLPRPTFLSALGELFSWSDFLDALVELSSGNGPWEWFEYVSSFSSWEFFFRLVCLDLTKIFWLHFARRSVHSHHLLVINTSYKNSNTIIVYFSTYSFWLSFFLENSQGELWRQFTNQRYSMQRNRLQFLLQLFLNPVNNLKIARLLSYRFRLLNIVRFQIRMKIQFYQQIPNSSVL